MSAPRTYVTDLTHFLDSDGNVVDGPAGKLARYLGLIVELGSVMDVGDGGLVPMFCSNPSRRRRCGSRLVVRRSSRESIEWECPTCGENGVIRNWFATRFGLGAARAMMPTAETADVVVRSDELWAMRRLGGGVPVLRRKLVEAMDFGGGYLMFHADHGDIEELRDLSSDAAGRAGGKDRRLLDRFAARMDAFRTTLREFIEPAEPPVDLAAIEDAGTRPEVIALAREIAAQQGRDEVMFDDLMDAELAYERGRRLLLH